MVNYYNQIKEELINNEIYKKSKDYSKNRNDLSTYYNVGRILIEAQGGESRAKYGNGLIKEYSKKLTIEIGKGYSTRSLKNMRKFYLFQKRHPLVAQLNWTHYVVLMTIKDDDEIQYYMEQIIKYNLSKRELINKIKNQEYQRLSKDLKQKLMIKEENKISDFIKNPILIKNSYNYTKITEKILKQLILEDMENFLIELGEGFCFIKSEYKIKIGDRFNYMDLLLYNIKYNCYVVIELKITEIKAEHIGQIKKYMNYIDKNIKTINQENTIGIIICKKDNKFVMEYVSDDRIFETIYELK